MSHRELLPLLGDTKPHELPLEALEYSAVAKRLAGKMQLVQQYMLHAGGVPTSVLTDIEQLETAEAEFSTRSYGADTAVPQPHLIK